jgi:hypothetical protein
MEIRAFQSYNFTWTYNRLKRIFHHKDLQNQKDKKKFKKVDSITRVVCLTRPRVICYILMVNTSALKVGVTITNSSSCTLMHFFYDSISTHTNWSLFEIVIIFPKIFKIILYRLRKLKKIYNNIYIYIYA